MTAGQLTLDFWHEGISIPSTSLNEAIEDLAGENSLDMRGAVFTRVEVVEFILDLAGKEIIIPIIKDWILEVNREEKFIQMFLPEGLMDVFLIPSKKDE